MYTTIIGQQYVYTVSQKTFWLTKGTSINDSHTLNDKKQINITINYKDSNINNSNLKMYSCFDDCEKLQELLKNWNKIKPKAVIYYLVKTYERLSITLPTLYKYFNDEFKYPVIIFHEREFKSNIVAAKTMTTSYIFFHEIQFVVPEFIGNLSGHKLACESFTIGYRHMCRFHSKIIYDLPIMQNVDYYWRLDDDSYITQPIHYDVFAFMKNNGFEYGYIDLRTDYLPCVRYLWKNVTAFVSTSQIQFIPTYFKEWTEPKMFYNNFEISRFSIWKQPIYQHFIDYIDHAGGIFFNRWGDAPIKSLGLSLFLNTSKLHNFNDIGYRHQDFHTK